MKRTMKKYIAAAVLLAVFAAAIFFGALFAGDMSGALAFCGEDKSLETQLLKDVVGEDAAKNFRLLNKTDTKFGYIFRYQQTYEGIDVENAQITISTDKTYKTLSSNGGFVNIPNFEPQKITAREAENTAAEIAKCKILSSEDSFFYDGENAYDAYKIFAENNKIYFISKQSGDNLYCAEDRGVKVQNTDAFDNQIVIDVEFENEQYILKDNKRKIYAIDFKQKTLENRVVLSDFSGDVFVSDTGTDFDPIAVSSFYNTVTAYDFYTNEENIGTSIYGVKNTNNDMTSVNDYRVYLLVNYGEDFQNAAFSFSSDLDFGLMCIGNGVAQDKSLYKQGRALDIIAHEYQHGITGFNAGLLYQDESGALDEAFSDIFGSLVEGNDPSDLDPRAPFWTIGENGVYDRFGFGYSLRSMAAGTIGQAYNMADKYTCNRHIYGNHPGEGYNNCDSGYVHENNTIITRVQYELCKLAPSFFTRERIGTLWFTTLLKLRPTSNFLDFSNCFVNSAIELGYDDAMMENVKTALSLVGLLNEKKHSVTFKDAQGAVIDMEIVDEGEFVFAPKIEDIVLDDYSIKFDHWEDENGDIVGGSDLNNVKKSMILTPVFKRVVYATYLDVNGKFLQRIEYDINSQISPYDYTPASDVYDYEFFGWTFVNIDDAYVDFEKFTLSKNATFVPLVKRTKSFYFFDGENSKILEILKATPESFESFLDTLAIITPLKPPSVEEEFTFEGWDMPLNYEKLSTGAEIHAIFSAQPRKYTAYFISEGNVLLSKTITYGSNLTLPNDATKKGYILDGWYLDEDLYIKAVQENVTVKGDVYLYAKWLPDEEYQKKIDIIAVAVTLSVLFIIGIPVIIAMTRRKKR